MFINKFRLLKTWPIYLLFVLLILSSCSRTTSTSSFGHKKVFRIAKYLPNNNYRYTNRNGKQDEWISIINKQAKQTVINKRIQFSMPPIVKLQYESPFKPSPIIKIHHNSKLAESLDQLIESLRNSYWLSQTKTHGPVKAIAGLQSQIHTRSHAYSSSIPPLGDINPNAIIGIVCSGIGLLSFPPLLIVGIIFSSIALSQIKKGRGEGKEWAQAGLYIGIIGIFIWLAILAFYILIILSFSF